MPYDEQVAPESDPPVLEPPPPVARLSGILAQPRVARTVVRAPLQPAVADDRDEAGQSAVSAAHSSAATVAPATALPPARPPAPGPEHAGASDDAASEIEPVTAARVEPQTLHPQLPEPPRTPEALPAPEPLEAEQPPPAARQPDDGHVMRYCGLCRARLRVPADDDRCTLGHKLSPAHAKRRWWQRLWRQRR